MIFIPGGGFECGEAKTYGDDNICENIVSMIHNSLCTMQVPIQVTRDIVFITIQYRVGYLGFFTTGIYYLFNDRFSNDWLPWGDSVCPGNLGLWDQTEALKWVQANIEAFGGNKVVFFFMLRNYSFSKNNVTVVGQSAGGASADFLHISPHSTGYFLEQYSVLRINYNFLLQVFSTR